MKKIKKGNNCYSCYYRKSSYYEPRNKESGYFCKIGLKNEGLYDITKCSGYQPNQGLCINGDYSPITFLKESSFIGCNGFRMIIHKQGRSGNKKSFVSIGD